MTCKKLCEAWPECECAVAARGWRDPGWQSGDDRPHTWHAYRWDPDRKVGTSLCGQWDLDDHDHAPFHDPPEGAKVCKQCQRIFAAVAKIAAAKVYAKTMAAAAVPGAGACADQEAVDLAGCTVYVAGPKQSYRDPRFDVAVQLARQLVGATGSVQDARGQFSSNEDWLAKWPGMVAGIDAVVFVADKQGYIGRGVLREIQDVRAKGGRVLFCADGKLWRDHALGPVDPDNWRQHAVVLGWRIEVVPAVPVLEEA